jgi:hypothetical protein
VARYWRGGTATWDGTPGSKWASTPTGPTGASVPTASEPVYFDASSTGVCTLSASSVARMIDCTNQAGSLSHPSGVTVNIGDSVADSSGIALKLNNYSRLAASSTFSFVSTAPDVQTINMNGKVTGNLICDGVGGSWKLVGGLTATAAIVTITNGTLDLNTGSGDVTCFRVTLGTGAGNRGLIGGTGNLILTATGATNIFSVGGSNYTMNVSAMTVKILAADATQKIFQTGGSGVTWGTIDYTPAGTAGSLAFSGTTVFNMLRLNPGRTIQFTSGTTTVGGLDVNGTPGNLTVLRTASGTGRVTKSSGVFSIDYVSLQDVTAQGGALWYAGDNSVLSNSPGWIPAANRPGRMLNLL